MQLHDHRQYLRLINEQYSAKYYQKYWIKCDEYYNMIKLQTEKQT